MVNAASATGRSPIRFLWQGVAGGLAALLCEAAAPALGAEAHASLPVSVTVANACSVSISPTLSASGRPDVTSVCIYPHQATLHVVSSPADPVHVGLAQTQGIRYFAVDY